MSPPDLAVALLTREYPPDVYGGAGVHVEYLARELARLVDVTVHCWGAPRPDDAHPRVAAYEPWDALAGGAPHLAALRAMSIDLAMAAGVDGSSLVHSHTWYANLAGHLAKLIYGIPHVATVHSLEPLRPWKAEQLGGGYALSSFCERTGLEAADAVIAVSAAMRDDLLRAYPAISPERVSVIHNGIDTSEFSPDSGTAFLERLGIDPDVPSVVFVGRITRQKGLGHLLAAATRIDASAQLVLCAGSPDTPELGAEIAAMIDELRPQRPVLWIEEMLPRPQLIQVMSHATVFVCPSVYEPLGIVNLEAMACETAVVATCTGGIPEVVDDGATGLLVPIEPRDDGTGEPVDRTRFAGDIADRVNELLADPSRAERLGKAGRARAVELFGWPAIAERVAAVYHEVVQRPDAH
ncbi:MAG TPA: glycogen synthase [Gaiellaceae bacterium]